MSERLQIYRCPLCGQVVEVLSGGSGELVCCGKPMLLLDEHNQDGAVEKHLPVTVRRGSGCMTVRVGALPHPMTPEHWIEWIEVQDGEHLFRRYLDPSGSAEADFPVPADRNPQIRILCNLHGLWVARAE